MANPYGKFSGATTQMVLAGTDAPVVSEARNFGRTVTGSVQQSGSGLAPTSRGLAHGGGERLFGANGEINASSKRELMEKIGLLLDQAQHGGFERQMTPEYSRVAQARAVALAEAQANPDGPGMRIIAEATGNEVFETLGRDGLVRQFLLINDLNGSDDVNRVKVRKKDVSAVISTTNINTTKQMVRQMWVYPGEYYVKSFVSIEEKELSQNGAEMLDEKFTDMLEQHMVQEDRHMKSHFDDQVGIVNPGLTFNKFTPLIFTQARVAVEEQGNPCVRAALSWDLWVDILAEPEFANYFDPVHKHAAILDGKLGAIQNVQLYTDGFRYDTLQVLGTREVYFTGPAATVGVLGQRSPIQTKETDRYNLGQAERGWFSFQIQSMTTFPRAVSRARGI